MLIFIEHFLRAVTSALLRFVIMPLNILNYFKLLSTLPAGASTTEAKLTIDDMDDTPISEIKPKEKYRVGFARKQAFEEALGRRLPLYHSAVVIQRLQEQKLYEQQKFTLIGRQSPALNNSEKIRCNANRFETVMDNEKNYVIPGMGDFNVILPTQDLEVYGNELQAAIASSSQDICRDQRFDLLSSNCYSASMYLLMQLMEEVYCRPKGAVTDEDKRLRSLIILSGLISKFTLDIGTFGLSNNSKVVNKLAVTSLYIPKATESVIFEQTNENVVMLAKAG